MKETGHNQNPAGPSDLPPQDVFFGTSPALKIMRQKVQKVANTDVPLLIQGDNGTGKEVLARLVHENSIWKSGPFVKVNCAAIPGNLIESELFGYEKGSFTGAYTSKPGRVELADHGTLFLDEIGDLDMSLQAKLLQFLQDGRFSRIGDQEERRVETRIMCATSRQLEEDIQNGRFRADFFYRINVINFKLPALRERRQDIPALVDYFVTAYSARFQRPAPLVSPEMMQMLQDREWQGNIRELENCMARCVILGTVEALEGYVREKRFRAATLEEQNSGPIPLKRIADRARRELERDVILRTLESFNWNRRKTAEALKISYRTLLYKVREAGLPMRHRKNSYAAKTSAAAASASASAPIE